MSDHSTYDVTYKCTKCGAEDHARLFQHEAPPPVLNCWKCGAGRKQPDIGICLAQGFGMFPQLAKVDKGAVARP
jgi:hypothetical protein